MNFVFELKHLRELNLKGCIQLSTETIPFEELCKKNTKIPLKRYVAMALGNLGLIEAPGTEISKLE